MMKVCVVGGSGYLGGQVAAYLKETGHEVTLVYRTPPRDSGGLMKRVDRSIRGDLADPRFVREVATLPFDSSVYCVSLNHFQSQEDLGAALGINVSPLIQLASLLCDRQYFGRFVYFSTMQVYGNIKPGDLIDETTPLRPLNNYGLTHLMCEETLSCLKRSKGLDAVSVRLSNGYGAPAFASNDCWWLVVNDLCRTAIEKRRIELKSDGTPQRDFIHVRDIARAVALLLETDAQLPPAVNLASGDTLTIRELAHAVAGVAEKSGAAVPIFLPGGVQSVAVPYDGDKSRFRIRTSALDSFGFRTSIPLTQGIADLLEFVRRVDATR